VIPKLENTLTVNSMGKKALRVIMVKFSMQ